MHKISDGPRLSSRIRISSIPDSLKFSEDSISPRYARKMVRCARTRVLSIAYVADSQGANKKNFVEYPDTDLFGLFVQLLAMGLRDGSFADYTTVEVDEDLVPDEDLGMGIPDDRFIFL